MIYLISNNLIMVSLGTMIFFSLIIAPLTFITLDGANAAKFIRKLFPFYYGFNLICLSFALLLGLIDSGFAVRYHIVLMCAILFAVSLFILMPNINKYRDSSNDRMFNILHKSSVVINFVQLILLTIVASGYY